MLRPRALIAAALLAFVGAVVIVLETIGYVPPILGALVGILNILVGGRMLYRVGRAAIGQL